jgi:hypothetical protein
MRMRRRRSRRPVAVVIAVAYFGLVAWLLSPLWGSASGEAASQASMHPAPVSRPFGSFSLGRVDTVPPGLPGYTPPKEANSPGSGEAEISGAEGGEAEVSGSEGGASEPVEPAGESASTGTGGGGSGGQPASAGGGGGSEEQSVIGFEG